MGRSPCCEKVGLKKGRWTAEEDEILMRYIQQNGEGSWRSLPKKAGLLRCGKSCRLRWINYLRADLKRGNISAEEEDIIIKLHGSFGNRWSLIAGYLPGRTDNEIKNYWNSHLSRRIHSFTRLNKDGVPTEVVMNIDRTVGGSKRRGGRTSRSAMKKYPNPVEMKMEKEHGIGVSPTLPLPSDKEAQTSITGQNEGRESMVSDPNEGNREASGPSEDTESGAFGPHVGLKSNEGTGSVGLATSEQMESGVLGENVERENGIWGPIEGIDDEFLSLDGGRDSPSEERGSVGVDSSKDRESEMMGANGKSRDSEWCSSLSCWFDDGYVGCLQVKWNDLDDKMEDGEGERWPWLWRSSSIKDGDYLNIDEFEQEQFGSWLMSTDKSFL